MSSYTGYEASTEAVPMFSVYNQMYLRNKCNFRDYQNAAVNGGAAGNTVSNAEALRRDQDNDHPMILFLELIGNDVCGKHTDPSQMTSKADFMTKTYKILQEMDAKLPKGSHVFIFGLA